MTDFKKGDLVRITEEAAENWWVSRQVQKHGYLWLVLDRLDATRLCLKSLATGEDNNEMGIIFYTHEVEKADV